MGLSILEYLKRLQNQTIPPLVLELILKSGRSFFIKNIFHIYDDAKLIPIRVWDFRALSEKDMAELLACCSQIQERSELNDCKALHPALDQGNLWVEVSEVEAIMEWHDRFWGPVDEEEKPRSRVGFIS